MYSEDLISIHLLAEKKKIMKKSEIETLIQELNNLSECEKQNIARMKEIAKVLVDFYMPNKNKNGWNGTLHKLWQADREEMIKDSLHKM